MISVKHKKRSKSSGKEGKRLECISQDLLVKLKDKKEIDSQWKQGQVSREDYGVTAQFCRNGVRKAKAKLELNFTKVTQNKTKSIYRCVSQKRKVKESIYSVDKQCKLVNRMRRRLRYSKFFCLSPH